MKLLIVTQKIDKNDAILGFFHRWVEEFSKHYEKIIVICLGKGKYNLPKNVEVLSLGKEEGASRIKYITRFYRYIWLKRNDYDSVFIHMNPVYMVLGGFLWNLWRKKVTLWFNHAKGGMGIYFASLFTYHIFYTSSFAFARRFKHSMQMPVGVDTYLFTPDRNKEKANESILSLGRISPVKNIHILVDALILLDKRGVQFKAHIYGDAPEQDRNYAQEVEQRAHTLVSNGRLTFHPSVPNDQAPALYNSSALFVNLTSAGSFDKTIIEAMACETLVITCNDSVRDILPEEFLFRNNDSKDLAEKLEAALSLSKEYKKAEGEKLRQYAEQNHSLENLMKELIAATTPVISKKTNEINLLDL